MNVELLVAMLDKHGIQATQQCDSDDAPEEEDLNRLARVFVHETDYDQAHRLFYAEREDEL